MSEFDFFTDDNAGSQKKSRGTKRSSYGNGWYFPLTLLGLVLVGGLSILMCFLTKNVADRPVWMMGLIFMVPAGAMFFSAMLLEFKTGVMTPSTSRKPQVIVAIVATLLTFLVGCICDAIYLYGGIRNAGVNFVMAVDRGDTASWAAYDGENSVTRGEALNECAVKLLDKMPSYTDVGMVPFAWEPMNAYPIQKAGKAFKDSVRDGLAVNDDTGASFYNALMKAVEMVRVADNDLPTRILLLTGGDEAVYLVNDDGDVVDTVGAKEAYHAQTLKNDASLQSLINLLKSAECTVYVITPTGNISTELRKLVSETGGLSVSIAEADTVEAFVSIITVDGDMLRATTMPAKILTGVMLVLEGLVVGICISIMLSVSGQKRFQMLLSPLMAVISFVMVKFLGTPDWNPVGMWWLWEGLSFLPLGLIFMNANDVASMASRVGPTSEWGNAGGFSGVSGSKSDASAGEWGVASSADPWNVGSGNKSSGSDINW